MKRNKSQVPFEYRRVTRARARRLFTAMKRVVAAVPAKRKEAA